MPPQENNKVPPELNKHNLFKILSLIVIILILTTGYLVYASINSLWPFSRSSCIQVVTTAKNPNTGEIETFGTPCDVPKEWIEISGQNQTTITDQFADWKTYRNEEYGFEFKYPEDWKFESDERGVYLNSPKNKECELCRLDIVIAFDKNTKNFEAKNYYNGKNGILAFDNPSEDKEFKIDEKVAYRLFPTTGEIAVELVVIPLKDIFIRFDISYDEEIETVLNQILSTFKFISTSTPQTFKIPDPNNLPPDPGEAGKKTLAGIDSDNDGLRDDVQRYIALTYPNSTKKRAALTQSAIADQEAILNSNDKERAKEIGVKQIHSLDCMFYIFDISPASQESATLTDQVANTRGRRNAYLDFNDLFGGEMLALTPESERKSKCMFNPDILPN